MKITWLGHSSFLIETEHARIVTDPYDETTGYKFPSVSADIVIVSHDHHDHNAVDRVHGSPRVITGLEPVEINGVEIVGVATFHDQNQGRHRGRNNAYIIRAEGLTLCHLGDLGHIPDADQIRAIGEVDVLMLPIGGTYTISPLEAVQTVGLLQPRLVIPMHYKAAVCTYDIAPLQEFSRHFGQVAKMPCLVLSAASQQKLPEVVVLDYSDI